MTWWTEARLKTAAKLWNDGQSATVIAAHLGGVTRSSVLGKIHRHRDLFDDRGRARSSKVENASSPVPSKPIVAEPVKLQKAKVAKPVVVKDPPVQSDKPAAEPFDYVKRSSRLSDLGIRAYRPRPTAANPYRHRGASLPGGATDGIPFVALDRFQCSFPLTDFQDPDGADMPCCGLPRRGGIAPDSAYCAQHADIAAGRA